VNFTSTSIVTMPLTVPRYVRPPAPSPRITRGVIAGWLFLVAAICTSVDWLPSSNRRLSLGELNRRIAAEPTSPVHRAARAKWYFSIGNFKAAIADLHNALELNPGDAGQDGSPSAQEPPSLTALHHGHEQLRRMLTDRPAMATHLTPGDELWTWAVRRFAGEHSTARVHWDPTDPGPCDSLCVAANPNRIQLRAFDAAGKQRSFDALWADAAVELCKVDRPANDSDALLPFLDEDYTSDRYIRESLTLHDKAMERARTFYLAKYLPWAHARRIPTSAERWSCFVFDDNAEAREARWRSSSQWRIHRNWYQLRAAEAAVLSGKPDEADRQLDALAAVQADYSAEQRALLHTLRAQAHLERSNPAAAVEALETAGRHSPNSNEIARLHARALFECGMTKRARHQLDQLIHDDPSNPANYAIRAHCFAHERDWTMALADCDRVVALEPDKPQHYARRAMVAFELKRPDDMARDIATAIELNPGDLGQNYKLAAGIQLSDEAIEHGRQQVRQMLTDRPAMATFIIEGDELWNWAARKFAGEDAGVLVDWDPTDPTPFRAHCRPGVDGKHGRICVGNVEAYTESKEDAFSILWAYAVFELHNVAHVGDPEQLIAEAKLGRISREQFIRNMIHREAPASAGARAFFVNSFLPYARSKNLTPPPLYWHCTTFIPDEFTRLAYFRSMRHWEKWDLYFDRLQAHWERYVESKVVTPHGPLPSRTPQ